MKFLKIRDVKSPEKGTALSSGIDFFIPNNLTELFEAENCKFTPSDYVDQKTVKANNFVFEGEGRIELHPGYGILIPTGIKIILNEGNDDPQNPYTYDLVLEDKSGICTKKGLIVGACVVDNDYRGEIHIHLINTSQFIVSLLPGQKIVQGIVRLVELPSIKEITEKEFNDQANTERGAGGFGSTNK